MNRLTRGGLLALALPTLYGAILLLAPTPGAAALLALRLGSIDHPLHLIGADFDQDGYDDLVVANFEAGTVTVLINQKDGTFALQKDSPNIVGAATINQPTLGPVFLATGDFNPEDVDGDRVNNDVDNCPNVYNPPNCPANDKINSPECFVDNPCKYPAKVHVDCAIKDPITSQCDSDGNAVGDQCQILDSACQNIDTDLDLVPDYDQFAVPARLDNCPLNPNPGQEPETAAGIDGICGTPDDNLFLVPAGAQCGVQQTPKVGAVCSRSNDLVVVNSSSGGGSALGLVRVRVNDTTGGLLNRFSLQASFGASHAVVADFNGDLRLDIVVSNTGSDALQFFPGAVGGDMGEVCLGGSNAGRSCVSSVDCPGGTCQPTTVLLAGGLCSGGTLNGMSCATSVNCSGGGTCRLSPVAGISATCTGGSDPGKACTVDTDCPSRGTCRSPTGPEGVAAADFNGDKIPDLAFANRIAGNVGILLNGGAAAFTPAPGSPFPVPGQPVDVLAGSLNGDACADLVVLEQGSLSCQGGTSPGASCLIDPDCPGGGLCRVPGNHGMMRVFTTTCTQGSLVAGQSIDLGSGHVPRGGALVDLDGDGNLDLAVADFSGGQVLIYSGSGGATFAPAVTLTGLANPSAVATLDYDHDGRLDLAVLGYSDNSITLYRNSGSPGSLAFSLAPTSPVSPWRDIAAMALFPADASVGQDVVMLNTTPPRLDVLSGTGTTFRGLPPEPLLGPLRATGMTVADLLQDGVSDLLVLDDDTAGTVTPLITELTGVQTERPTFPAGNGPVSATVAPLTLHGNDYDQDGVLDDVDDCPTRYNPPNCPANDTIGFPHCFVENPCTDIIKAPVNCLTKDPITSQCDSDGNGVGDQCQILDAACQNIDTDLDLVPDYDQFSIPPKLDNCPWTANADQADADGNHIGDICDGSGCDIISGAGGICHAGPRANARCSTAADCDAPVNDAVVVDQAGGALSFLIGDASGSLRPAPGTWSAIGGLANPVAAVVGRFAYTCTGLICAGGSNVGQPCTGDVDCPGGHCQSFPLVCDSKSDPALMVAEKGAPGSGDDDLKLFFGDGAGGFAPPASPVAAQAPLQGDPSHLLIAPEQNVCGTPWLTLSDQRYHFDDDNTTSVIAVVEPGTSTVDVLLPSNEGPAPPPGNPNPLTLPSSPVDATFVDVNQDGYVDLVVLSSGDGDPATPNLTIFLGIGNGLFFTDPSFNPTDVPDGMTFLATGQVNLSVDSTYPDVVLFDSVSRSPVIMTNIVPERADIDHSGRVDGYDLALLARSFGSVRGEDFTIQSDGTLLQNPDLGSSPAYTPTRLLVGSGVRKEGMDLPVQTGTSGFLFCDQVLQPLTGLYGLPVDVNLDGRVDGTDLALIASRFGRTIP